MQLTAANPVVVSSSKTGKATSTIGLDMQPLL